MACLCQNYKAGLKAAFALNGQVYASVVEGWIKPEDFSVTHLASCQSYGAASHAIHSQNTCRERAGKRSKKTHAFVMSENRVWEPFHTLHHGKPNAISYHHQLFQGGLQGNIKSIKTAVKSQRNNKYWHWNFEKVRCKTHFEPQILRSNSQITK